MYMEFTIKNKIVLICAKRNSGKSIILKSLVMDYREYFETIFLICPTEQINKFYSKDNLVKENNIFESWNEKWANELIKKMTEINSNKSPSEMKHILLILDDCIADIDFKTSKSLKLLFVRSRHIGISLIITTQYLNSISPLQRNNSDFILTSQQNQQSIDILTEQFLPTSITKKDFMKYYSESTKNYSFLLLNNNSTKTNSIDELIQVIRTEI